MICYKYQSCGGRLKWNLSWRLKLVTSTLVGVGPTQIGKKINWSIHPWWWCVEQWYELCQNDQGRPPSKEKSWDFIHKATRQFSARSHMVSVGGGVGVYFLGGSHFQPCVWFLLIFLSATTRDALQNFAHPGCFPYSVLAYYFSLLSSGWVLIVVCGLYFSPGN